MDSSEIRASHSEDDERVQTILHSLPAASGGRLLGCPEAGRTYA